MIRNLKVIPYNRIKAVEYAHKWAYGRIFVAAYTYDVDYNPLKNYTWVDIRFYILLGQE